MSVKRNVTVPLGRSEFGSAVVMSVKRSSWPEEHIGGGLLLCFDSSTD
jgi:hypothetical protein